MLCKIEVSFICDMPVMLVCLRRLNRKLKLIYVDGLFRIKEGLVLLFC